MTAKIAEIHGSRANRRRTALKAAVEKRLADMAVLIKTRCYLPERQSLPMTHTARQRTKSRYRAGHDTGSIILHEAAAKALRTAGVPDTLPNLAALQAEYEQLQAQKEALYADYRKLKKKVKEYGVIKQQH